MTVQMCEETVFDLDPYDGNLLQTQQCDHPARWIAYNPHDGFNNPICNEHKKEFDREVEEEDMEYVFNEFPQGLTVEEFQNWTWPWDDDKREAAGEYDPGR